MSKHCSTYMPKILPARDYTQQQFLNIKIRSLFDAVDKWYDVTVDVNSEFNNRTVLTGNSGVYETLTLARLHVGISRFRCNCIVD